MLQTALLKHSRCIYLKATPLLFLVLVFVGLFGRHGGPVGAEEVNVFLRPGTTLRSFGFGFTWLSGSRGFVTWLQDWDSGLFRNAALKLDDGSHKPTTPTKVHHEACPAAPAGKAP